MVTVETTKNKKIILALVIVFSILLTALLVLNGLQAINNILTLIELILILVIIELQIWFLLLLHYRTNNKNDSLILVLIIVFSILLTILLVLNGLEIFDDHSLHLSWILGLIALILLTLGTILVLYDEPTYVMWHGLAAGSAWILTLLNVISLITLNDVLQVEYSGALHFVHIVCGAIGLGTGLASMLLGISGQRRLAKLSGIITYACWWGAFFMGLFL
jgi:hypothetical protein